VLTEGVVPYLANDEVASLAEDVAAMNRARFWVVDYFSEESLKYRRKYSGGAMRNAPFKFEPGDWFAFFEHHGWKVKDVRYYPKEARQFSRPMPLPLWLKVPVALSRLLRPWAAQGERFEQFAGFALLEPASPH
jgi:O-methyltransferase involved in polyketide biosynthesis